MPANALPAPAGCRPSCAHPQRRRAWRRLSPNDRETGPAVTGGAGFSLASPCESSAARSARAALVRFDAPPVHFVGASLEISCASQMFILRERVIGAVSGHPEIGGDAPQSRRVVHDVSQSILARRLRPSRCWLNAVVCESGLHSSLVSLRSLRCQISSCRPATNLVLPGLRSVVAPFPSRLKGHALASLDAWFCTRGRCRQNRTGARLSGTHYGRRPSAFDRAASSRVGANRIEDANGVASSPKGNEQEQRQHQDPPDAPRLRCHQAGREEVLAADRSTLGA
jgi:hypothetical protein